MLDLIRYQVVLHIHRSRYVLGADMSHDTSTGHALEALAIWGQDKTFGSSQKDRLHYIYNIYIYIQLTARIHII